MAAKRNKSQAKRNGGGSSMPGWAWLVLGLALGIGIFLIAPKFLGGNDGFFRPQPDANAKPPALDSADSEKQPIVDEDETDGGRNADGGKPTGKGATADNGAQEQDYSFYNLLSGEEKPISDAELAAKTRAEEARAVREADRNTDNGATGNDGRGRDDNTANRDAADRAEPPAAIDATTPPRPRDTASADANRNSTDEDSGVVRDARYLLQAGAFAASGDAEALKAKIAFLGLSARVESAQIKGKTVYRVRMGPYGTATDLAEAKRKLAGGGLPAMAIKAN